MFYDITPVLHDARLLAGVVDAMAEPWGGAGITHVVGIEARGFILGAPVALALGAGFIPMRKPGKLPWESVRETYALEYGEDSLEAHRDACHASDRVLIVDDVLATGGTAAAAGRLVTRLGGHLTGWSFLLEISGLGGAARLAPGRVEALVSL
jgi:adenine phosphoribosyltransferase